MWKALTVAATALVLAGCATTYDIGNDVSTYSQWPAQRPPGTYAFERLPSQASDPARQQMLEDSARGALEVAGFKPAADPKTADVNVQLNARVNPNERAIYDDPFWWRGGFFYGRRGHGYWGPSFGMMAYAPPSYEREVALLIRDRRTNEALFEARAINDGGSPSINALLPAMFEAAMKDFPNGGVNPRRIVTRVQPKS